MKTENEQIFDVHRKIKKLCKTLKMNWETTIEIINTLEKIIQKNKNEKK